MTPNLHTELSKIVPQPQRQDGTVDQLRDLYAFALRLGLYDAADYVRQVVTRADREIESARS